MSPQRRTTLVSVGAAVALIGSSSAPASRRQPRPRLRGAPFGTDFVAHSSPSSRWCGGAASDDGVPKGMARPSAWPLWPSVRPLARQRRGRGARRGALAGWIAIATSTAWWVFAAVTTRPSDRRIADGRLGPGSSVCQPCADLECAAFRGGLVGTFAVFGGLVTVRSGWQGGDSFAALFVAILVVVAAARLIRRNVDMLMDRAPADAVRAARAAIATLDPPVEVRRLRLRGAAGRTFTDVVIGVSPGAVVGSGPCRCRPRRGGRVRSPPGSDVVVHVEPVGGRGGPAGAGRESAMSVTRVREFHNLSLIELPDGFHVSLHLKLPGDLALDEAHEIAEQIEQAIVARVRRDRRRAESSRAARRAGGRSRGG